MISGLLWLTATKALGQAITWVITIIVVRLLSPQDYGLMGMSVLLTGFLLLFNELGLGAAIVRYPELTPRHISALRWAVLGLNVALFLLLAALAPIAGVYFEEPRVTAMVRVLGTVFVIQAIGLPSACMLQRELKFKRKSQAELIGNLVGSVATLICATAGFGVWSLVTGHLLQQVTTNALYLTYHPLPFARTFSLVDVRQFANFGLQVAAARVLWFASTNADFVVIGRVLGAVQLGYYSLAFQFSSVPIDKIVSIVTQVAFPSFSELQKDDATIRRYYLKLVGTVAFVTFPMFLGLFLVAESAVPLFLTNKWAPVVLPLKILCIGSCVRAIGTMNTPLLLAKGRSGIVVLNHLLQAIVMPVAFYAGAQYGLEGVAVAWLLAWPVLIAIMTGQTLQLVGLTFASYMGALKHAAIGSAVMVGIVTLVQQRLPGGATPASHVAVTCALGGLLYVGYQVLFNRPVLYEMIGMLRPQTSRTSRAMPALNTQQNVNPDRTGSGLGIRFQSTSENSPVVVKAE